MVYVLLCNFFTNDAFDIIVFLFTGVLKKLCQRQQHHSVDVILSPGEDVL